MVHAGGASSFESSAVGGALWPTAGYTSCSGLRLALDNRTGAESIPGHPAIYKATTGVADGEIFFGRGVGVEGGGDFTIHAETVAPSLG